MSTARHYPTDMSDAQWEVLQLVLPPPTWRLSGLGRKPMNRCISAASSMAFLRLQDGMPMAHDAYEYRQCPHDLWLFSHLEHARQEASEQWDNRYKG
jgi:transposase